MGLSADSAFPRLTHFLLRLRPSWRKSYKTLYGYVRDRVLESRKEYARVGAEEFVADSALGMIVEREGKTPDSIMSDPEILDELMLYIL